MGLLGLFKNKKANGKQNLYTIKSMDYHKDKAISMIRDMRKVEEIRAFTIGENRKSVNKVSNHIVRNLMEKNEVVETPSR